MPLGSFRPPHPPGGGARPRHTASQSINFRLSVLRGEALLEQVEKKHLTLNCYNMHVVTKAELAEELRVSRPRVSQFIDRGLPVRPDGRIDLKIACHWIVANCEPGRAVAEAREWLWLLNRPR